MQHPVFPQNGVNTAPLPSQPCGAKHTNHHPGTPMWLGTSAVVLGHHPTCCLPLPSSCSQCGFLNPPQPTTVSVHHLASLPAHCGPAAFEASWALSSGSSPCPLPPPRPPRRDEPVCKERGRSFASTSRGAALDPAASPVWSAAPGCRSGCPLQAAEEAGQWLPGNSFLPSSPAFLRAPACHVASLFQIWI